MRNFDKSFKAKLTNIDKYGNTNVGNALFYTLFNQLVNAYSGSMRGIRTHHTAFVYRHYDYENINDLFNLLELLATHLDDKKKLNKISDLRHKFFSWHKKHNRKRRDLQRSVAEKSQPKKPSITKAK